MEKNKLTQKPTEAMKRLIRKLWLTKFLIIGSIEMSEHIIGVFSAFLLSLSILVVPSYSQNAKLKVDGQRIKSYVEWMSRDKLEGPLS